jgi:hypothetical protein
MNGLKEPEMSINGHPLKSTEVNTIRVALNIFYLELQNNGLGDDDHGKFMTTAYCENISSILGRMSIPPG